MPILAQTDYCCTATTKVEYTTFRWDLPKFSELKEYYDGLESSKFIITCTDTTCCLRFYLTQSNTNLTRTVQPKPPSRHSYNYATFKEEESEIPESKFVNVEFFFHGPPLVKKVKVILSIVDAHDISLGSYSKVINDSDTNISFELITAAQLLTGSRYLHDDTLSFLCKIINVKGQESIMTSRQDHVEYFGHGVQQKVQTYFNEKTFCDVIFNVKDQILYGHRLILAANSPVFEAMFKTEMSEQKERLVEIDDIDSSTFKSFLKYIYTGCIDELSEICKDLIIVADKYLVQNLRKICETSLADKLDVTNAMEYLVLSHLHEFIKLKTTAIQYVKSHQQEIIRSPEFKDVCKIYPELITEIFEKPT